VNESREQLKPVVNELVEASGLGDNQIIRRMEKLGHGVDSTTLARWREGRVEAIESLDVVLALACCICLTEEAVDRLLTAAGKKSNLAGLRRSAVDDTKKLVEEIDNLLGTKPIPDSSTQNVAIEMTDSSIHGPVVTGNVEGGITYNSNGDPG